MKRKAFKDKLDRMARFVNALASEVGTFVVKDPIDLGEDFVKTGVYILKGLISKEKFMDHLEEIWDEAPTSLEIEEKGEVLFEA